MKKPKKRKDKRVTISLAAVVLQWAEENMEAKGYNNNLSAYIGDLIRRDQERQQEKSTSYGLRQQGRLELNEPKKPGPEA